jgi:hypothetical protein
MRFVARVTAITAIFYTRALCRAVVFGYRVTVLLEEGNNPGNALL